MPFASIFGHAQLVALLRQAVSRRRVPQSLIFAGPEGVGKRAIAMALAQAVNCPRAKDGDACGECPTCLRIARGQHSDVTLVDQGDEPSIKIQVIRDRILATIGYRPFEASRRVYIIDPADAMTDGAQDALLKTLEEPPAAAMIVLVTAYPDSLAATIRSRCRRLRFGPLSDADVARVLVERAGVAALPARTLASAAGGSVSRALAEQAGELEDDRDAALGLLAAARQPRVGPRLKASAALARNDSDRRDRDALATRLTLVAALLRDLAAIRAGADIPLANADLADTLRDLSPAFDLPRVADASDAIDTCLNALGRNASPKIVSDWIALAI